MSGDHNEPLLVIDDPSFDQHCDPNGAHPERPERLLAAREGLFAATARESRRVLPAREITRDELLSGHHATYVGALEGVFAQARAGTSGMLDPDTYVVPGTPTAALRAAAGAVDMARGLLSGQARRGFALLRPPGHHAEQDRAMGFCLLNNVALAAHAALLAGAERVAIIDFDVHHGNGTQHAFENDPRVLFVSLHQWPLYPGTGAPEEVGRGDGAGATVNLALPSGEGIET
jgi:acetoin utilization deacetylase AcuC-like enzyme